MANSWILGLAGTGFIISAYAYYVRYRAMRSVRYKAWCDVNEKISCTAALTSPRGSIIGVSNSMLGMILYALIFASAINNIIDIVFYLSLIATLASLYLAHVLVREIKHWCIICISTYFINALLLTISFVEL